MSTASGFVLGFVAAVCLTIVYGDKLQNRLSDAVLGGIVDSPATADLAGAPAAQLTKPLPIGIPHSKFRGLHDVSIAATPDLTETAGETEAGLEQRWAEFAAQAGTLVAVGDFPWRSCFTRAAASYELPEPLLLAIASGESHFDPSARSSKGAVGLMQILWPSTSRHLGVLRKADLYDPCINVDAGARYLQQLAGEYDNNLHLMVAAYNYGPARVSPEAMPDGARGYSAYIYQHLQQVLGFDQPAARRLYL